MLDVALDALVAEEQRIVRAVLTRHLMSIDLSTGVHLQLGDDLTAGVPPSLRTIVLPELRDLLHRVDPTPAGEQGSGAVDWADLDDRIHFIAQMFRCYQESPFLFDAPFTPAQVERIDAGERPGGPTPTRESSRRRRARTDTEPHLATSDRDRYGCGVTSSERSTEMCMRRRPRRAEDGVRGRDTLIV